MNFRSRLAAVLGTGALLVAGGGAVSSAAASGQPVTGGNTVVEPARTTMTAVHARGIKLVAISPATFGKGMLRLPTKGGAVNLPNYRIDAAGGFAMTKGSRSVTFTHIVLSTKKGNATATISGVGTEVALLVGDPNRGSGGPGRVQFGGFSVTLAPAAVKRLDHFFHTTVFAKHNRLGVGTATIRFKA